MAHDICPKFKPFNSKIREIFEYFSVHGKRNHYFAYFLSYNLWDFLISFGVNIITINLSETPNKTERHDHSENGI